MVVLWALETIFQSFYNAVEDSIRKDALVSEHRIILVKCLFTCSNILIRSAEVAVNRFQ